MTHCGRCWWPSTPRAPESGTACGLLVGGHLRLSHCSRRTTNTRRTDSGVKVPGLQRPQMPVEPIDLLWGDTRHVEPRPVSSRAQYQGPITMNGQRSLVLRGPPVQLATGRDIPLVVAVLVHD